MKQSVAVLPFNNWSANPEDGYFSHGITEEIINALAQIQGLRVLARTSSFALKSQAMDVKLMGTQLGVDTILQGSVRRDQNRVRITAQLINVETGYHLFSTTYDRPYENIFELQDEISLMIADRLREEFGHFDIQDKLVQRPTQQMKAYDYYLKGRHLTRKWDALSMQEGFAYLEKALEEDPGFALPHLEIHYGYLFLGSIGLLPTARALELGWEHIQAAKELLSESADLYLAEASHYFWYEWDVAKANQYLQKAINLRPSSPDAFVSLATTLMHQNQYAMASDWIQKAKKLDPLSALPIYYEGMCAYWQQDYEVAIKFYDAAIRVNPQSWFAYLMRALSYLSLKQLTKAAIALETLPKIEMSMPDRIGGLGLIKVLQGDLAAGRVALTELENKVPPKLHLRALIWKVCLHTQLEQYDQAIDLVEQAAEQKFGLVLSFHKELFLEPLLAHPRFKKIMQSVHSKMGSPTFVKPKSRSQTFEPDWIKEKIQTLHYILEEQEAYLEADLNLRRLAKIIKVHPNQLSQLINEQLELNFNTFLNQYRLKHFLKIAKDPQYKHLSILGLAYESGFKSKTVFNSFFKKQMRMTPRTYLKNR